MMIETQISKRKSQKVYFNLKARTYNLKPSFGFSLMELLVVIAIMAILISFGFSSFSTAQKKSRDSKRKSDVKEIQQAMEQYYSVCNYIYPLPTNGVFTSINCPTPPLSIMPTVPMDPRASPYYCPTPVASNCTASNYRICAALESETPSEYCVNNQQ